MNTSETSFGLEEKDFRQIVEGIKEVPEIEEAKIFGSRAKGNCKPGSDIDISITGEKVDSRTASRLAGYFDNLPRLIYKVDVLHYDSLNNQELKDHIDRVGKVIFKRDR